MQTHLVVGHIPFKVCRRFSGDILPPSYNPIFRDLNHHRRRHRDGRSRFQRSRRKTTVISSSSSNTGGQNHYVVLGIARNATQVDIKRAYRLLARKFHPDVNKDSRAGERFKTIHCSYEVLSNESTRSQYDRALKHEENSRFSRVQLHRHYNTPDPEVEDAHYSWSEKRRESRFYGHYSNPHFYSETSSWPQEEDKETTPDLRNSFVEALKSTFLSIFLLYTLGCLASLTFSTLTALLDKEFDMGYKLGFMIAWILGGKGGILLTLCLKFASWVCGKASSSVVVLMVVATWFCSSLARHAPLPHGALLTLFYMSIKLQVDST